MSEWNLKVREISEQLDIYYEKKEKGRGHLMGGAESGIWQEGTAGDGQAFEKLREKSLVAGNTCRLATINSQGGKGEKKNALQPIGSKGRGVPGDP